MTDALAPGAEVHGLESNYLIEGQLGEGGFSQTFAGKRPFDGKRVVLKVLRLDRAGELKALELFEREAKVLAGLEHPRIPKTLEFFAWDGSKAYAPYEVPQVQPGGAPLRWIMIQERVEGRSLREGIRERQRLDPKQIEQLLVDLLEVLEYLHGLNPPVVHRDIKPANVILDPEGHAHLVDFGAIQDRLRRASTVGSTSVGTFGYIPMEQMMGQAREASDLFALAMTVLVVASHREPEDLPIDDATAKVKVRELGLSLSAKTKNVLDRMVEPIIGQRFGSARECLDVLQGRALLASPGGRASMRSNVLAPRPAPVPVKREPTPLRHPWLWKASGGGGGLAAGLIYLVFFDSFSETELIQLSALWLAPVAFGIAGYFSDSGGGKHPVATALLWAGGAVAALVLFIFGIFPAL